MRFVQITDLHIEARGRLTKGHIDSAAHLSQALSAIGRIDPAPDFVLATGDLTETGAPEEFEHLAALLDAAPVPIYLMTGNHDSREALRAAFPAHDYLPADGFLQYVLEGEGWRLLCLDSKRQGSCGGEICAQRLDWLRARLDEAPERPTLLALHHPPFWTRSPLFDMHGFEGLDAFRAEIAARPNLAGVVCGHVHRRIVTRIGHVPVGVGPATAYTYSLPWRAEQGLTPTDEAPGFLLHDWEPGQEPISHTILLEPVAGGAAAE